MHLAIFIGLPLMLVLELGFLPDFEHYAGVRIGLALLSFSIYLASYRWELIRQEFTYINYIVIYLVISHLIFLTYVNEFPFFLSSLLISMILAASLFFRTRSQLLVFQASMLILVVQASFLEISNADINIPLFLILYVFMNVCAYAIQDYIFRQRDRLAAGAERLKRSNAVLEQFAYATSHDLQEPLRTVTAYVQLLQRQYKGQLDESADEYIHFTVDATVRMQSMIQSLLKFSRNGAQNITKERLDVNEVMSSVMNQLEVQLEESKATVRYSRMPHIQGDKTMISSLFQNLISNAIKYKNSANPVIDIDFRQRDGMTEFVVSDNGIGIPEKYQERLFGLFFRVDPHGETPGTGIGLAVCKRIVMNHGGEIWVNSKEGEGSSFHFTIAQDQD